MTDTLLTLGSHLSYIYHFKVVKTLAVGVSNTAAAFDIVSLYFSIVAVTVTVVTAVVKIKNVFIALIAAVMSK